MRKGLKIKKLQSWRQMKRQLQLGLLCFALLFVAEIGRIHAVMHGHAAAGFSHSDSDHAYLYVAEQHQPKIQPLQASSEKFLAHFWSQIFSHDEGSVECATFDSLCSDYTLLAKTAVGCSGFVAANFYLNFSPCQEKQQAKAAFEARAPPFK